MRTITFLGLSLLFPLLASAQFGEAIQAVSVTPLGKMIFILAGLVYILVPIVGALALGAFFWGLAMYIFKTGSEEQRKKGIEIMLWGIIALFTMVSIWGIVSVLDRTFGISTGAPTLGGSSAPLPIPFRP